MHSRTTCVNCVTQMHVQAGAGAGAARLQRHPPLQMARLILHGSHPLNIS